MTPAKDKYFCQQLEIAKVLDMLVLIHTPHQNRKAGASRSMDAYFLRQPIIPVLMQFMPQSRLAFCH